MIRHFRELSTEKFTSVILEYILRSSRRPKKFFLSTWRRDATASLDIY